MTLLKCIKPNIGNYNERIINGSSPMSRLFFLKTNKIIGIKMNKDVFQLYPKYNHK